LELGLLPEKEWVIGFFLGFVSQGVLVYVCACFLGLRPHPGRFVHHRFILGVLARRCAGFCRIRGVFVILFLVQVLVATSIRE
jgi:hypothetical protein